MTNRAGRVTWQRGPLSAVTVHDPTIWTSLVVADVLLPVALPGYALFLFGRACRPA